ncbi:MAG: hypothetical protein JWM41_2882 [Gemmatimonadetes bacterium]|nr:hypothetical protein [Gemmatimonadota bacterium]
MSVYSVAREFLERALATAECRHDRAGARLIAQRIVEVSEQEDFDECRRLDAPRVVGDAPERE